MGIHGLMTLLKSDAQDSYKEIDKRVLAGKIIAIDASILLYQFIIQIRAKGSSGPSQPLTNDAGEITSHLQGFFNRTANLLENGINPVFVFDGKPPALKHAELVKRRELKKKAESELKEATERAENAEDSEEEEEAIEDMNKAAKRNIHITKQQTEEVKILLGLMGLPVIVAPSEAEAQCAELVKKNKAYAISTEDMDALTFGTPIVLRKLTMPESAKEKVVEIHIDKILKELEISYDEFVDLCILCGCDYCESIKGIGPKTALKLVRQHKNIETIIANLPKKYTVPASLIDNLEQIRLLFKNPDVDPADSLELVFNKPDKDGIIDFLVNKKGFNEERVLKVIGKIDRTKTKVKVDEKQPTIDAFFTVPKLSKPQRVVIKNNTKSTTDVQPTINAFFKPQ
jgi:flap endonuclease-1